MRSVIINTKIVTATQILEGKNCVIQDGIIQAITHELPQDCAVIDGNGNYLIPGFIDLHCHGGNGFDFMDATAKEMQEIAKFHLSHGTTTMLATSLTAPMDETNAFLNTFAEYKKATPDGVLKGVFLEGPWLNPTQCGAQDINNMLLPSAKLLRKLKESYPFILRVAAAPELDEDYAFAKEGKRLNIVVSAAHTDADFSQMEEAHRNGYTLMTHLYSGMKGMERKNSYRIAGAIEAGLYFDGLDAEIIADGKHLPLELLRFIYKCKGTKNLCLVTDGTRASGLKNGETAILGSKKNGVSVIVEDDVAKLPDRQSFAGSTATADRLYKTMARAIGKDMVALSHLSSTTPARIMGWNDRGEIAVGKRADLLLVNENLDIEKIITKAI